MAHTLFFGTRNPHKLSEIQGMLDDRFDIVSFEDFGDDFDVEETEDTLQGNAALKAKAYYERTGLPCFADDSGLMVDALDGAPGVYSARYAGTHGDHAANNAKLLQALDGVDNRSARFATVIAYYDGWSMTFFEGIVEGKILTALTGEGGFGYDPLFQPTGYDQSFAEMSDAAKNDISHRGRAMEAFTAWLLQK